MLLGAAWAPPGALALPPESMMVILRPLLTLLLALLGWGGSVALVGRCLTGAEGAMSVTQPPC